VVTGQKNGQTDLWQYDFKTKKIKRLTNNRYAEILPAWSPDGSMIAFSTDELALERGRNNGAWQMNLAVMDVVNGSVDNIDVFPGADKYASAVRAKTGDLFSHNRDGFGNLYRYDFGRKKVWQLTNITTGITGITPYSPALTVREDKDKILYTHYTDQWSMRFIRRSGRISLPSKQIRQQWMVGASQFAPPPTRAGVIW
jgi:Tol biopolymer transport system component